MGEIRNAYKILPENLKGIDHSEDLGVDERTISEMGVCEVGWERVGWIHAAQDRDQWRALVNTIMICGVP
jgi:hypothetical protein